MKFSKFHDSLIMSTGLLDRAAARGSHGLHAALLIRSEGEIPPVWEFVSHPSS
jgi:hypothetical protein